jgi:hypothetical protein
MKNVPAAHRSFVVFIDNKDGVPEPWCYVCRERWRNEGEDLTNGGNFVTVQPNTADPLSSLNKHACKATHKKNMDELTGDGRALKVRNGLRDDFTELDKPESGLSKVIKSNLGLMFDIVCNGDSPTELPSRVRGAARASETRGAPWPLSDLTAYTSAQSQRELLHALAITARRDSLKDIRGDPNDKAELVPPIG